MWADSLLAFERGHLLRLGIWAVLSAVVGVFLWWWVSSRRVEAPFIRNFAIQMFAWGCIDLAITAWGWQGLELRDYAAAMNMQHFLWLNVGLDVGYVAVGASIAISGWTFARRLGAVGAGVGVIVQGLALFVLDVRLLTIITPSS